MSLGRVLIVGAGFAGAVHARVLADAGYLVRVIDRRRHIAGNAYDYVDETGVRVHAYGPHLFHTKNRKVLNWLEAYCDFMPYKHKVRALLPNGNTAPLPINRDTINIIYGTELSDESALRELLASKSLQIAKPQNAAEHLYSTVGIPITDLLFRPYTKKMWGLDLEQMSADVVKRIPLRFSNEDTYFDELDIQVMPVGGYVSLFERLLGHENITIDLDTPFSRDMMQDYLYCFNSMPIDEYYGFCYGELPYRSIRFHHFRDAVRRSQEWSVTNFTDSGPFTRETAWHVLPGHSVSKTDRAIYTREEPCDYRENNFERYYPVKAAGDLNQILYEKYRDLSERDRHKIRFIGRCGTYQYLDMDQVVNQSLVGAARWLQDA